LEGDLGVFAGGGGFCLLPKMFPIHSRTLANSICLLPEDLIKKVESMQTKFFKGRQNVAGISPNFPATCHRVLATKDAPKGSGAAKLANFSRASRYHRPSSASDTKITDTTRTKIDGKPLIFDSFVSNTFKVNCGRPGS